MPARDPRRSGSLGDFFQRAGRRQCIHSSDLRKQRTRGGFAPPWVKTILEKPSTRAPLVLVNAVGMTRRILPLAPGLSKWASRGWTRGLVEVVPAVTAAAQATILTGKSPQEHGIVANGWLFRDTMEVRFWQQSNRLVQAEPLYQTALRVARSRGESFRCAKLFWWFNQGAEVALSLTPKPHYGCDGNKVFAIASTPALVAERLERALGPFPFPSFWGPAAGLPASEWIARAAASVLEAERPDLTLVYLPHLDYDPQRFGPSGCDLAEVAAELDRAAEPLLDAAQKAGARVWIVSEYGHVDVVQPSFPNRLLRSAGLLSVRAGPFGETIDFFASAAFAVCDHQLAHVYVRDSKDVVKVGELLRTDPGVARVFAGGARREIGLDHPRSGEIVLLARPDRWFAYPYWVVDSAAPDFARTVDIHRKPGFDPCEMFFDPRLAWPRGRAALRLLQKKLGFRTRFDVIPLDASIVRGSHGLPASDPNDRPLLIGEGTPPPEGDLPMASVHELLLEALFR